jgi:hypothetical protein
VKKANAPVHCRLAPTPAVPKPGVHAQVVAPAPLVLPAGHAVQMLAPDVALYVLAVHSARRAAPSA